MTLPPIDAHAHVDVRIAPFELVALSAFVMAVTRSLDEGEAATKRRDALTLWGVGCHPAVPPSVAAFDRSRFASILQQAAFVGEVGLDRRSRVPMDKQIEVLSSILDVVGETPRAVSLHSTGATGQILDVLEGHPVAFPILHWWRGTASETSRAIEMGCLFSLNGHEARSPKVIGIVPSDRVLTETDFPHTRRYDPSADRPGAVATTEHALSDRNEIAIDRMRAQMWLTFAPLLAVAPEGSASSELRAVAAAAAEDERERTSGL